MEKDMPIPNIISPVERMKRGADMCCGHHSIYPDLPSLRFLKKQGKSERFDSCNWPGGRLNKKDGLTRYGNSHVKDKTS